MAASEHITQQKVVQFVNGQLTDSEEEAIIAHINECDDCLAIVDAGWHEQETVQRMSTLVKLDQEQAQRLQQRLIYRIHFTDLGGNIVRLGVKGFADVMMALLRPFIAPNTHKASGRSDSDDRS